MNKMLCCYILLMLGSVNLFSQQSFHSEEQFKNYFEQHYNDLNPIEGIWKVSTIQEFAHYDTLYEVDKYPKSSRVAIIKNGEEGYDSFKLTGEPYDVTFKSTEVTGVYFYNNFFRETNEHSKSTAVINTSGEMEYAYEFPDKYLQYKLGDSYEEGTHVMNKTKWQKIFPEKKK